MCYHWPIDGNDISPILPQWALPNIKSYVDDIEADWVEPVQYGFLPIRCHKAFDFGQALGLFVIGFVYLSASITTACGPGRYYSPCGATTNFY